MRLTIDKMKEITKGAVEVREANGWFQFYRFTSEQMEAYRQVSPNGFYIKAFASAGVSLRFTTNSAYFKFNYVLKKCSSRKYAGVDVYENGALIAHFCDSCEEQLEGHMNIALSPGEKTVEVYFPWSCSTGLSNVIVADGAVVEGVEKKRKMICFGEITVIQGRLFTPQLPEFYSDKRLHPNDAGFWFYARNAYDAISKELL